MNSSLSSIILRVLALLVAGIGFYKFFFADDSPTRKVVFVNKELGVAGEVTGFNKARGYKIYINSSDTPYNFDDFENEQIIPNSGLGYYLEHGDSIAKSPNSSIVLVKRKGQLSEWHLVEQPAGQPR